jgi:tripartite-type tricarboxylate transporter receptor subunit TctC
MSRQAKRFTLSLGVLTSLALLSAVGPLPARAQTPFYAGKTVQMLIGMGPGGGYDIWGRTVARHIGKHLPGNPNVVPQNLEGAGGIRAANFIYSVAPKDGTTMGIITRDAPLSPITGAPGAKFDSTQLSWVGTPTTETNVCIAYKTAQVKTAQDLFTKQLTVGGTGAGTGTQSYPKALNELLGMKFRLVAGYPSSSDVFLAMERGEVEGICESLDSVNVKRPDWIPTKTINVLFQGGTHPNPELKDVPFVVDLAKTAEDKKAVEFLYAGQGIGRPFIAPPGIPADRLKMLREAFNATMKDPEFIAEVKMRKMDLAPETGEYLEDLMKKIYATPKSIVDKIGEFVK